MIDIFYKFAILILILVFGIPLIIALIKNKGSISYKNLSLSLGHKAKSDPAMKRISDYMTDKLEQIRQKLFAGYLRLQKQQGCPEEILNENEDSEFVQQMLGNIVWSGNGIKSIKSILEKSLLDKSFLDMNYPYLINYLMESIEQNTRSYINRNYRARVNYPDGTTRERMVTNTEWVDSLPVCMDGVKSIIEEVLTFAREQYGGSGK